MAYWTFQGSMPGLFGCNLEKLEGSGQSRLAVNKSRVVNDNSQLLQLISQFLTVRSAPGRHDIHDPDYR